MRMALPLTLALLWGAAFVAPAIAAAENSPNSFWETPQPVGKNDLLPQALEHTHQLEQQMRRLQQNGSPAYAQRSGLHSNTPMDTAINEALLRIEKLEKLLSQIQKDNSPAYRHQSGMSSSTTVDIAVNEAFKKIDVLTKRIEKLEKNIRSTSEATKKLAYEVEALKKKMK